MSDDTPGHGVEHSPEPDREAECATVRALVAEWKIRERETNRVLASLGDGE